MLKIDNNFLTLIQIVTSISLILLILIQQRGSGLSSVFGGSGSSLSYRSVRGVEKLIFVATVITACLFIIVSLVLVTVAG